MSGSTASCTYTTTGEDSFTVPANVSSIDVVAVGGAGGSTEYSLGGAPDAVEGSLAVTAGDTLWVEVAGEGGSPPANVDGCCGYRGQGGYGGGGFGGGGPNALVPYGTGGGGGGGESDVRMCSIVFSNFCNNATSFSSRLIVAAGGGGAGGPDPYVLVPDSGNGGGAMSDGGNGTAGSVDGTEDGATTSAEAALGGARGGTNAGGAGGAGAQVCNGANCGSAGDGSPGAMPTFTDGTNGGQGGGGNGGGGGGGGGYYGGGGGGGSNSFDNGPGAGSAHGGSGGGGGGSDLIPPGGHTIVPATEAPMVTISYVVVVKANPTFSTQASPTSAAVGATTTISDVATFDAIGGFAPTGDVAFTLYSDSACQTPTGVSGPAAIITSGTTTSATFSTTWAPPSVGTYYWRASYAGDTDNFGFTSACGDANEELTVTSGYTIVGLSTSKPSYRAGSAISGTFDVADTSGTPIPTAQALAIGASCLAQVSLDNGQPQCATITKKGQPFKFAINTVKATSKGPHTLTVVVTPAPNAVTTAAITVVIT
jgi:hypothetical protein